MGWWRPTAAERWFLIHLVRGPGQFVLVHVAQAIPHQHDKDVGKLTDGVSAMPSSPVSSATWDPETRGRVDSNLAGAGLDTSHHHNTVALSQWHYHCDTITVHHHNTVALSQWHYHCDTITVHHHNTVALSLCTIITQWHYHCGTITVALSL